MPRRGQHGSHRRSDVRALAVASLLVGAALLGAAGIQERSPTTGVDAAQGGEAATAGSPSAPPAAALRPHDRRPDDRRTVRAPVAETPAVVADPTTLVVPALGLAVPLLQLGLEDDGTVEVPVDAAEAGWFRHGPPPGALGSAVVLGHVDSRSGPGVFFRLRELQVGDPVEVGRADGSVARFAVTGVETYRKQAFPADLVYGSQDGRTLQLVTCGGEFDRTARSYLSNVVVSATLVGEQVTP